MLSDYNVDVDQHCKNPGRVYRLPFFYNVKSPKYDTVVKAEIMEGEYGVPTYKVEDIFQRFGYDYAEWDALYIARNKRIPTPDNTKATQRSLSNGNKNCADKNLARHYGYRTCRSVSNA